MDPVDTDEALRVDGTKQEACDDDNITILSVP